ncbi:TolC family protein, partial [Thermodesulfobacteriota bacterium]
MTVFARNCFQPCLLTILCSWLLFALSGCKSASEYRLEADRTAETIIREKQEQLLGSSGEFSIERPSDILRRRLLLDQDLPYSSEASLGTDKMASIIHWPEKDYPKAVSSSEDIAPLEKGKPVRLSLMQALQVGAMNNFEYQTQKEEIFRSALSLDLNRNDFDFIPEGQARSSLTVDKSGSGSSTGTVKGVEHSGSLNLGRTLQQGTQFTAALAVDLVKLLTQGRTSSFGIVGDASISIPLLRGSGIHIVTEPLTQAERNVMYAIYDFERFKKRIAVDIARDYLEVLRQLDQVDNVSENYRNLTASARRTRSLADAGRTTEIEVDQAVQNELIARSRWINTTESYKGRLDTFKKLIGLPPDADMELDRSELAGLTSRASEVMPDMRKTDASNVPMGHTAPAEEKMGPLELDETFSIELGLKNRLDLRVLEGRVYDARRSVIVQADALGAELTLFGEAGLGQSRSIATAGLDDARLRADRGVYTGLFTLDLPFERTAERNAYRESFIELERAARAVQNLEDDLKLSIRARLREM